MGHPEDRCFRKHPDLAPPGWSTPNWARKSSEAHVTHEESVGELDREICLVSNNSKKRNIHRDRTNWIIDSECSSYMTFNIDSFQNYNPMQSKVNMGTIHQVNISVIGDIKVTMDVLEKNPSSPSSRYSTYRPADVSYFRLQKLNTV